MSFPHEPLPIESTPSWRSVELGADDMEFVTEELLTTHGLAGAIAELTEDMPIGASRTVSRLPYNVCQRDGLDAITHSARYITRAVREVGVEDLNNPYGITRMIDNGSPEDLGEPQMPEDIKGRLDDREPIGYLHLERLAPGENKVHAGYLDRQARTSNFVPLVHRSDGIVHRLDRI